MLRKKFSMWALRLLLPLALATAAASDGVSAAASGAPKVTNWHLVWTGGQSNSVGTNSQKGGYPTWATTARIQNFCSYGNCKGTFKPAAVPLYNELNVGFSQTFANLLLPTLPADHGIVLLNTGVGGTGFSDGNWVVPNGRLTVRAIAAVEALKANLTSALGGEYSFHTMLWHQGEEDAADNRDHFSASYCHCKDLCTLSTRPCSFSSNPRPALPGPSLGCNAQAHSFAIPG